MIDLSQINGELISIPGIRVWGGQNIQGPGIIGEPIRTSLIMQCEHGAIELWEEPYESITVAMKDMTHLGGVLWHKSNKTPDAGYKISRCKIIGGDCYGDGSTLPYLGHFSHAIKNGHWLQILQDLASFHSSWIGCNHCKDYA
jgi:hypothetical protein